MTPFALFPTPYPDELLYSVISRYHLRCGTPSHLTTSKSLWGRRVRTNLYLPQSLGMIIEHIPAATGLTEERFINESTLLPYLSPFMPTERTSHMYSLMESKAVQTESAYHISGLLGSGIQKWQYLRYCEHCWNDDVRIYGEPYWHRQHFLPGFFLCPVHETPIQDSLVPIRTVQSKFFPASFEWVAVEMASVQYSEDVTQKLRDFAADSTWFLQNGNTVGGSEAMHRIFDQLLRVKGYRNLNGTRTDNKRLYAELCKFYGQDLLGIFDVNNDTLIPWTQRLLHKPDALINPVHYLLLMRFLAVSIPDFYTKSYGHAHPYGDGPWPCRNPACPHYLQDVISNVMLTLAYSRHQGVFACPHCGFIYKRGKATPKEQQYEGQIRVVEYGYLWHDTLKKQMAEGVPIMQISESMHCGYLTVLQLGVKFGFYSEEKLPVRQPYKRKRKTVAKNVKKFYSKSYYRQQWNQTVREYPVASRSELMHINPQAHKWLRQNDLSWYEANSPVSRRSLYTWEDKDELLLKKVMAGVAYLRNLPGKPLWISRTAVERYGDAYTNATAMKKGHLPKTQKYLTENLETREGWQKRKIQWAVGWLFDTGQSLSLSKIMITASITPEAMSLLQNFMQNCVDEVNSCGRISY